MDWALYEESLWIGTDEWREYRNENQQVLHLESNSDHDCTSGLVFQAIAVCSCRFTCLFSFFMHFWWCQQDCTRQFIFCQSWPQRLNFSQCKCIRLVYLRICLIVFWFSKHLRSPHLSSDRKFLKYFVVKTLYSLRARGQVRHYNPWIYLTSLGKTLAFVLPLIQKLKALEETSTSLQRRGAHPRSLILVPTRELAKQVCAILLSLLLRVCV